ncbi:MAG: 5'-methylthioadenosine/adenosylhomocysteine nucleosidase [Cellulosilyticum sp.]|nr:5'-methylthioadenosine/adenosylhomocysteine nucleosidase [Cellulosilyticum sp.]
MIGIICAMDEEVISLKRKMHVKEKREIAGMEFFIGTVDEKEVAVVRSCSGKVNAAICTQVLVDIFNVEYIISTGVAGGLYPELNIGDMIVSSDIVERELCISTVGNSRGELTPVRKSYFEANQTLVKVGQQEAESLKSDHKVYVGRIASEDEFICSMKVKEDIYTTFTAYCAEMEGAAIAHACFLNQIPFVAIRTISDKVDPSTDIKFEEFVDIAAKNASKIIEGVLRTL